MNNVDTKTTRICTKNQNIYEIQNTIEQLQDFILGDLISEDGFIPLRFETGELLFIKKSEIESFYIATKDED